MEIWKDEYLLFDNKYENHVNKFIAYLKLDDVNKSNTPAYVSIEDIDNCIGHYNKIGKIQSVLSMANHLEAIKAFYAYIIRKGYVKSDVFQNVDYADFKEKLTIKYSLKAPKKREYLHNEIICEILKNIDNYFYTTNFDDLTEKKRLTYLNKMSLRVFIKLGLIAPAKKNVILKIAIKDFYDDFRFLTINNVKIRIPNSLRNNIISALKLKKELSAVTYDDNTLLFNYLVYGETKISTKRHKYTLDTKFNEIFCTFLKQHDILDISQDKTTYSVEVIMNTTIHNMVKNGVNPYYISKISGITIGVLENKYYKEKECINYSVNVDKEINYEIAKSDYYNYIYPNRSAYGAVSSFTYLSNKILKFN